MVVKKFIIDRLVADPFLDRFKDCLQIKFASELDKSNTKSEIGYSIWNIPKLNVGMKLGSRAY